MPWWKPWGNDSKTGTERPDYYEEGIDLARQERFHEALTSFRLALREDPQDAAALEQMAVVYTRIGMTDEAIKMYARALAERPASAAAHYGIAFLLLARGRYEAASEHLRAFLEQPRTDDALERQYEHARVTLDRIQATGDAGTFDGG
jgi:Flp pilus assembly protein TadD